jgi:hypothetical protein
MRLLVDMNLSPDWVAVLKRAGWDAVHWSMVGKGTLEPTRPSRLISLGGWKPWSPGRILV